MLRKLEYVLNIWENQPLRWFKPSITSFCQMRVSAKKPGPPKSVVEPLVEKHHALCHSQVMPDADVDRWQPTNRSPGHGWPPS